jgi:GNAT superfamily N-acetyltransferase
VTGLSWRPMKAADLPVIGEIAQTAHPLFPEAPEIFAEKQRLFEPFCFTLEFEDSVAGYCFSHPWLRNRVPALNRLLGAPPESPDCLFLHDVALAPEARGKGASNRLVEILDGVAQRRGLNAIALVALYGSDRLWRREGFVATEIPEKEISSYGEAAIYMVRTPR